MAIDADVMGMGCVSVGIFAVCVDDVLLTMVALDCLCVVGGEGGGRREGGGFFKVYSLLVCFHFELPNGSSSTM